MLPKYFQKDSYSMKLALRYYRYSTPFLVASIISHILFQFMLSASTAMADTREEELAKVSSFSILISAEPENAGHYLQRGNAHYFLNNLDLAIADYTRSIRLDDRQDEAYFGRGMALGRSGLIDAGIEDLSVYLQRHPHSSVAYTKRGVRHIWKGDFDKAERDLLQAVKLDKNNAEAHDDLGVIYAQSGKNALAAKHFQTTIQLDPGYQKAYHNLAMVSFLGGLPHEALVIVNAGLELNPDSKNSMMLKASILTALGRNKEAQAASNIAEFLPEGNWTELAPIK